MSFYEFAKQGLLPGSLGLLLLGLVVGLAALPSRRTLRFSVFVLVAFTGGYWMMSMPTGAWLLGRLVSYGYPPVEDPAALVDVQAIVVLDGGTARYNREGEELASVTRLSAVRALEAARLYDVLHPRLVVVSGGTYVPRGRTPEGGAIREALLARGVPAARLVLDTASRNTREHAANVSALLRATGVTRFALVTSAVHMRRAMRAFSDTGLEALPAPAPLEAPEAYPWWPTTAAVDRSWEAWYEVFGLLRDLAR